MHKLITKFCGTSKNIFFAILTKIAIIFIDLQRIIILVITYLFCSKVTLTNIRYLYLYMRISGTKN